MSTTITPKEAIKLLGMAVPMIAVTQQGFERFLQAREMAVNALKKQIQAEESFEWCDGCKEYDQEQHCCHRYSKVIRQAFEEMKVVHCIDCRHSEYDEVYKDRYCHYNGKAEVVDDYHFCRDGEKRDDDVTCENCDYSEKYTDGLILCRRTKTSHRVSATSTCGKGKRGRRCRNESLTNLFHTLTARFQT